MARALPSPGHRRRVAKATMLGVSAAIEHFALAGRGKGPTSVIALFQHRDYYARRSEIYDRIASSVDVVVVAYMSAGSPTASTEVGRKGGASKPWHVTFAADDALARQWSVVVLSPDAGACITGIDLEAIVDDAPSLDSGRIFTAAWSFRRADAYAETVRLRGQLALDPDGPGVLIDTVLRTTEQTNPPQDERSHAVLDALTSQLDVSLERQRAAATGPEIEPRTGLHTRSALAVWSEGSAPGTLVVGLVLVRLHDVGPVYDRYGSRAEYGRLTAVADAMRHACPSSGRVFRLGRDEFLIAIPAADRNTTVALARAVGPALDGLRNIWPFVPVPASRAFTVTYDRPLPVQGLVDAARCAEARGIGLVEL